jgi:hypothetical protein
MIDSTRCFRTRPDARYRNIGGEGIVVRQAAGEVLVLNEVGVRVPRSPCRGQAAFPESSLRLGPSMTSTPQRSNEDVLHYVQELVDAGIVESSLG